MATLRDPEAPPPAHRQRDLAESFGSDPARYDRARPPYPRELAARIVAGLPGRDVLDVGIGTGLSAAPFRAVGCRVLGVEADPRMAALARERGYDVEVANFEDWERSGRTFDAVVSGQSWHWIDPDAGARKAARALRPDGSLVLFWNSFALPPEVSAAIASATGHAAADLPRPTVAPGHEDSRDRAESGIRAGGGFDEPVRWQLDWHREYTRDQWLDGLATGAGMGRLSPDRLAELRAAIGAAIDELGGAFTLNLSTIVLQARRLRTPS